MEEVKSASSDMVILVAADGYRVEVPRNVAEMSALIKEMLDDEDGDNQNSEIPLPNVQKDVLEKVVEFCKHYPSDPMGEIEKPIRGPDMKNVVSDWYAEYIDVEQSMLFSIASAANYLDIPSLITLASAKIASLILGKSPDEMKR